MAGVNKVILVGHLGKNPEVKQLANSKVANITMATSETYKNKDGATVTNTEWHRITLWGKKAEIAEKFLLKGMQIYVEGKLKTESWTKDEVKHYTTTIVADNFVMLGMPNRKDDESPAEDVQEKDDLPF